MTRKLLVPCLVLCFVLVAVSTPAEASSRASRLPHSHAPYYHGDGDGPIAMAQAPDGTLWAVWSYARGGEFDVAVSRSIGRTWTPPELIGSNNGWNDRDPQIAFLTDGSAIITWWQEGRGEVARVLVSCQSGAGWTSPEVMSDPGLAAQQPRLYTEGESVSVGFITMDPATGEGGFTLRPVPSNRPKGGTNGPDPIPTISILPGQGSPPEDPQGTVTGND